MATLTELNIYSPNIEKVDPNNDKANQQLANRTLYLKTTLENLQNFISTYKNDSSKEITDLADKVDELANSVNDLSNTSQAMDERSILAQLTDINKTITELQKLYLSHTHNYAGSARPSGDANSVDVVEDTISEYCLVGSSEAIPNKLRRNAKIKVEGGTLTAPTFSGDLKGIAEKASQLANTPKITLSGDIVGSVDFAGNEDVVINTSLKEQTVSAGEYGTIGNYTLGTSGSITVPDITVNSMGLVTKIRNRTVTLPKNMGINGIASSMPTDKKIFVLGTSEQAEKSATYSQEGVFINNRHLYSNSKQVINTTDFQDLKNKTYEGYELQEACSRGVDDTVGGTPDDIRLITSNALYRHKHKYAISDTVDGKAKYVNLKDDNENKTYFVTNNDKDGVLSRNTTMYVQGKGIYAEDLNASKNMYIPGGKVWVESVEVPVDDNAWTGNADIAEDRSELVKKTREVMLNPNYYGDGNSGGTSGAKIFSGMLLSYLKNGYVPADNTNTELCDNLVLATTDGLDKSVLAMDNGKFDLRTSIYDGKSAYVGVKGQIIYDPPTTKGTVIKKIGFVEGSYLLFNPNGYALINK